MRTVLDALVPVFAIVLLGYGLRHYVLTQPHFWQGTSKLVYFLLLPALLITRLAPSGLTLRVALPMWGIVLTTMMIIAGLVFLLHPHLAIDGPGYTSMLQGSIRPNTYTGLAMVAALYGNDGLSYAAIALAGMVPLANLLSVGVLVRHGTPRTITPAPGTPNSTWLALLISLFRNPLVIACIIGIAFNLAAVTIPRDLNNILTVLAQAALPIGLLTVGAGLRPDRLHQRPTPLLVTTTLKLLLSPLLAWSLSLLVGATPIVQVVSVIFVAIPCATSSYILAEQLGGDYELMAGILTVETLVAAATLPILLFLLNVA
ncbi:MAG: AEC family transporter [Caldilineaceae bacterium]